MIDSEKMMSNEVFETPTQYISSYREPMGSKLVDPCRTCVVRGAIVQIFCLPAVDVKLRRARPDPTFGAQKPQSRSRALVFSPGRTSRSRDLFRTDIACRKQTSGRD